MRISTIGAALISAALCSALALAQTNQDAPRPATQAPAGVTNPAQAPAEVIRPAEPSKDVAKPAETPAELAKPVEPPKPVAAPPEPPKPVEAIKPADAPKAYIPGLEQFMGVIQSEHMKLWFAGKARNWDLAAYQLAEIKDQLGDIQDLIPKLKNVSLTDLIDAVIVGPITDLEKALDAKDARKFAAGFDNLTTACNSCHEATDNGFIVIQRPVTNPFANQRFEPRKR